MRDQYEVEVTLPNERSHLLFDAGKKLTLVSENADWYAYSAGQNLHYFRQVQKNGINVLATMRYLQEHARGKNRKAGQQSWGGLGYMQAIVVSIASLYFSISGASAENNSTTVTKDKVTLAKFECPNEKSPELAASWLATIPPSQLPKVNDPVIYNAISEIQWPVLPDSQTSKLFSKAADRMYAKIAEREGKLDLTAIDKQLTSIGIKKPNEKITFSLSDALGQDSIWADKVIDAHISNLKIQPSLPCEKVYSEYAALFHPNEKSPLRYGRRPEVQTTRPGTLDSGGISLQPFSPTNPVLRPDQVQLNALGRLPIPYDPLGFPEVVYLILS